MTPFFHYVITYIKLSYQSLTNCDLYTSQFHKTIRIYGTAALRDRFQFIMTRLAAMRSDSVCNADLCDLYDFTFLQPGEHDP